MVQRDNNIIPISMAVLLHVALFSSMLIAVNFTRHVPITPMAIQATLVSEVPEAAPPVARKEPEREPEPVVQEPEPEPEPDNSEQLRLEAEEQKRIQDALIEKERLEKLRQQNEAERLKKEREEAERKKDEEAKKEREREEAERKRKEDEDRQRQENERIRKEQEAEQRQQEITDEQRRLAANSSQAMEAYKFSIAQRIRRSWSVPASAGAETACVVNFRQLPSGDVVEGTIRVSCNSNDEAVKRSVEAAIRKSSPLPPPSNPDLFIAQVELNLRPEQQN